MNPRRLLLLLMLFLRCCLPPPLPETPKSELIRPSYTWNGKVTCTPSADTKLQYFHDDTEVPLDYTAYGMEDELTRIYQTVLQCFFSEFLIFDPENLPPRNDYGEPVLESLYVYDFSFRDDLIVLANVSPAARPLCYPFFWSNDTLTYIPVSDPYYCGNAVCEFSVRYGPGYPFLLAEVGIYSNRRNGTFSVCRLEGSSVSAIISYSTSGLNQSGWQNRRDYPSLAALPSDTLFDCIYEDIILRPSYADCNQDSMVDIILSQNFQCVTTDAVLFSEPDKMVYLYTPESNTYTYCSAYSAPSPLRHYWRGPMPQEPEYALT